jgi:hypothetical protein
MPIIHRRHRDPALGLGPEPFRIGPRTLAVVGLAGLILVGLSSAFLIGLAAVGLLAIAVGAFEFARRRLHRQTRSRLAAFDRRAAG